MGARSQATESTGEVLSPDQELGVRGDRTFMYIQGLFSFFVFKPFLKC